LIASIISRGGSIATESDLPVSSRLFANLVDRHQIEVMQFLPPPPHRGDQIGGLQNCQMLAHRLARHIEPRAKLAERLAVVGPQTIEQLASAFVSQCFEHRIHGDNMQPFGYLLRQIKNGGQPLQKPKGKRPCIECLHCPRCY